jgi:hypothetical protein
MYGSLLFISGTFSSPSTSADGSIIQNYAVWDASAGHWADVFAAPPNAASVLVVNDTQLWAVDAFGAPARVLVSDAQHSYSSWTVVAEADAWVHTLAFGPDGALYVGGFFSVIGGVNSPILARYSQGVWSPLPGGSITANQLEVSAVNALAVVNGLLYIGGYFSGYQQGGLSSPVRLDRIACVR